MQVTEKYKIFWLFFNRGVSCLLIFSPWGGWGIISSWWGKKSKGKGEGSVVSERKSLGEREGMLGWYGWKLSGKEGRGGEATSLPLLIFFHAIWMLKIWLQPQHLQNITPPFNLYFFSQSCFYRLSRWRWSWCLPAPSPPGARGGRRRGGLGGRSRRNGSERRWTPSSWIKMCFISLNFFKF